jgi:hypothetical protein
MKRWPRVLLTLALGAAGSPGAGAGEVIAHPSVVLNADEVRDVFLGEKQFSERLRLAPVDNAGAQAEFLSKVLQSDLRKYEARWTRKSFRDGLAQPPLKGSDAEVLAFVRATPGAVGYLRGNANGVPVKVLEKY